MSISCLSPRVIAITSLVFLLSIFLLVGFHHKVPSAFDRPLKAAFSQKATSLQDVHNQTLGFEKILVLSLPSRPDRRDAISLAASLTGLRLDYVDGVTEVGEKALPLGGEKANLTSGELGNWRAHMNALRTIVERNITSALILEDDADWDIRIKAQMDDFAKASRLLVQPKSPEKPDEFLDPTYPQPKDVQSSSNLEVGTDTTSEPSSSPYGDIEHWDLFWLGHCGCTFPEADNEKVALGRAVISDDETVPEKQHVRFQFGDTGLVEEYPAHTRVVSRVWMNACTLGYAVSLPGARRLLYELSVNKMTGPTDMMLRSACMGTEDRVARSCLTVQPQLFQHHRAVGSRDRYSDISDQQGPQQNAEAYTRNVRWSTRMNMPQLLDGSTEFVDQFKDGQAMDLSMGWK